MRNQGNNSTSNGASGSSNEQDRPSTARRKYLRENEGGASVPMVSNFFPLERYYDAADKVLASFTAAFEHYELDEAYVYGLRYCTFCLEGLKQHDYYNSSKYKSRRLQTNRNVQMVITKLEQVADWMDKQELERREKERKLRKQQEELRQQQILKEQQRQFEELQKRIEQQKHNSNTTNRTTIESAASTIGTVEQSAFAKLQRLRMSGTSVAPTPQSSEKPGKPAASLLDPPTGGSSEDDEKLPPPVLPPPAYDSTSTLPSPMIPPPGSNMNGNPSPPSYNQILESSSRITQHSYFGPGSARPNDNTDTSTTALAPPAYDQVAAASHKPSVTPSPNKSSKRKRHPPIRSIIDGAKHEFSKHRQDQTIQISALQTYQGRVSGSINGCTVISALVVATHLKHVHGANSVTPRHVGVTDSDITRIIDYDCVPLLRVIRSKLDLSGSSLIIPSDVHDHMVDCKLLYQHKFVGAAGGNILDPFHISEVLDLLQYGGLSKDSKEPSRQHLKAAATLFYHEHVISIVKFPTSPTEAIYDFIDSLPSSVVGGRGKRTRCHSIQALAVQLQHYACMKLSDSNQTYIDRNGGKWEDSMADFDPRVFQAFVWTDLPPPPKKK